MKNILKLVKIIDNRPRTILYGDSSFYFLQLFPPAGMSSRPQFLPHLPVFFHACGAEFDGIVTHGKIDVVDGVHEKAVLIVRRGAKEIALYRIIRHQPAEHHSGLFIRFALLVQLFCQQQGLFDEFVGKGSGGRKNGITADGGAMPEMGRSRLLFRHDENTDDPGSALLAAKLFRGS